MRTLTSESVTEGHPDKVADSIADAVLDGMLLEDANTRAAIEVMVANGVVVVAGEASTEAYVDIAQLVRERLLKIGYDSALKGIDGASCGVMVSLNKQSPDIAQGVDDSWEIRNGLAVDDLDRQGAGDQGMMFGYACDETPELMPLPIMLAHRLAYRLTEVRKNGELDYLRPDGKTQVSIDYVDGFPTNVNTVVVSTQHSPDVDLEKVLAPEIERYVIRPVLEENGFGGKAPLLLINPTGRFVTGGPAGDAGLTGRKIIVDTYGGMARHGGGAFSGKDPSKVDRSATYAARWVAKNVVSSGLASKCEVQLSYAIGKARPTSVYVDTFGTSSVPEEQIASAVNELFDLRPAAIVENLAMRSPIYSNFTCYGHFGVKRPGMAWEETGLADKLANMVRG